MTFKSSLTLLALSSAALVSAKSAGNGNFTISFFSDSEEGKCDKADVSKAPTLTTNTVPYASTCFNVSDIFTNGNDTGFQNNTGAYVYGDPFLPPQGIYYLLKNADSFDSKTNYSRVWYQQVNLTGDSGPGEVATWNLRTYAFPDCRPTDAKHADDDDVEDKYPFFDTSCQTESDGDCQAAPNSIQSFSIQATTDDDEKCLEWAMNGDASAIGHKSSMLAAAFAGAAAYLLI